MDAVEVGAVVVLLSEEVARRIRQVPRVFDRPYAGRLERHREVELTPHCALAVQGELTRGGPIAVQDDVGVRVRDPMHEHSVLRAVTEQQPGRGAEGGRSSSDGVVVLQPHRHVMA